MPKAPRKKYYAVRVGREGPQMYDTWSECNANVSRWPGAIYKSFTCRADAEQWLSTPHRLEGGPSSSKHLQSPMLTTQTHDHHHELESLQDSPALLAERLPNPEDTPAIILSDEQERILGMVKSGENVFFTGSAGTGKSVLLRAIIEACGGRGCPTLAITASTGIASVNIGGTTLHSWAGIGIGQEDAKKLVGKFFGQKKLRHILHRWRDVKTLILDEISMIDGVLFDKLDYIARALRKNDNPFGGIQLVLSGDFCQLPPVPDRDKDGKLVPPTFAFEADSWSRCIRLPVVLTKVFRQKEQAFVDMLNNMRMGRIDDDAVQVFRRLSRPLHYEDGIGPTQLYPTRAEVDRANEARLRALPGEATQYTAFDCPGYTNGTPVSLQQMERLLSRLVVPQTIQLKVGAQVMLIKNMIQGALVNGSVGQVIRFSAPREAMQDGTQIGVEEALRASGSERDVRQILSPFEGSRWPVVRFTNGRELLCVPTDFTVDNAYGEMEAKRRQVPLILAYALSVHKSQGQTLERVKVDLSRTFENGQAYVALSRATCMKTLEVLNFDPSKVMVHSRILAWHNDIEQREAWSEMDVDADETREDFEGGYP